MQLLTYGTTLYTFYTTSIPEDGVVCAAWSDGTWVYSQVAPPGLYISPVAYIESSTGKIYLIYPSLSEEGEYLATLYHTVYDGAWSTPEVVCAYPMVDFLVPMFSALGKQADGGLALVVGDAYLGEGMRGGLSLITYSAETGWAERRILSAVIMESPVVFIPSSIVSYDTGGEGNLLEGILFTYLVGYMGG
jgi:hypothetical protein